MNTVDVGGIAGAGCALGVKGKKKKEKSTYLDEQGVGVAFDMGGYGGWWWAQLEVDGGKWMVDADGCGWMRLDQIASDANQCREK